ncbi:hypothetical protein FBU31_004506, partial [Coemansia sp. 'formosensis']
MSSNDRRNNRQANDADRPLDMGRDRAQVDMLWQRIISTVREAGDNAANAQAIRRYARPARLAARINAERASAHAPTPPDGRHFVGTIDISPSSSPPRSRRRVVSVSRRREPTNSSLSALLANQRLHLSQLISTAGSAWLQGNDGEGQPETEEFEPPVIQGPIVDFEDVVFDEGDSEDHAEMLHWEDGEFPDYDDMQLLNSLGQTPLHLLDNDEEPLPRIARPQSSPSAPPTTDVHSSVMVRQPWNTEHAWGPYIYQQPVPNNALGGVRATYQGVKDRTLPGTDLERSPLYSLHSAIAELRLNFISTNDNYARSSTHPRNMLRTSYASYTTTSRTNVHVELCFEPDRHCVVERIFVQAPTTRPRCTELMVFASNRRCNLEELNKYDGFTFAQYEKLAQEIKGNPKLSPDPMPIAHFWLTYEDGYKQLQVLPRGV